MRYRKKQSMRARCSTLSRSRALHSSSTPMNPLSRGGCGRPWRPRRLHHRRFRGLALATAAASMSPPRRANVIRFLQRVLAWYMRPPCTPSRAPEWYPCLRPLHPIIHCLVNPPASEGQLPLHLPMRVSVGAPRAHTPCEARDAPPEVVRDFQRSLSLRG